MIQRARDWPGGPVLVAGSTNRITREGIMGAQAIAVAADHVARTYWITRQDIRTGPPVAIARDMVIVRRTSDPDADYLTAIAELHAHGLLGCGCCGWEKATNST